MSRLTNKKLVDLKYGEFLAISKEEYRKQVHEAPTYKEIYTKLGKFEDLQDELGCPLDVVFKALKNQTIYTEYAHYLNICILKVDEKGQWLLSNTVYIFYLKDYGKTWWICENGEN